MVQAHMMPLKLCPKTYGMPHEVLPIAYCFNNMLGMVPRKPFL